MESVRVMLESNLNNLAARHFDWVERMGWHKTSVLECLGLICSEVGETADEAFGVAPTPEYCEELSDILLRTFDLAHGEGVDLGAVVASATVRWRSTTRVEELSELMVDIGKCVNTARAATLGAAFGESLGVIVKRVIEIAKRNGVDIEKELLRKMALNEQRGTRGRLI